MAVGVDESRPDWDEIYIAVGWLFCSAFARPCPTLIPGHALSPPLSPPYLSSLLSLLILILILTSLLASPLSQNTGGSAQLSSKRVQGENLIVRVG